jgi:hypothetical protein
MSGEVLRSLRVSKVKTPILILSALAGVEEKIRGLGGGVSRWAWLAAAPEFADGTQPRHRPQLGVPGFRRALDARMLP